MKWIQKAKLSDKIFHYLNQKYPQFFTYYWITLICENMEFCWHTLQYGRNMTEIWPSALCKDIIICPLISNVEISCSKLAKDFKHFFICFMIGIDRSLIQGWETITLKGSMTTFLLTRSNFVLELSVIFIQLKFKIVYLNLLMLRTLINICNFNSQLL